MRSTSSVEQPKAGVCNLFNSMPNSNKHNVLRATPLDRNKETNAISNLNVAKLLIIYSLVMLGQQNYCVSSWQFKKLKLTVVND